MSNEDNAFYEFGSFRLISSERILLQNNSPVRMPPKAFELLLYFVEKNNQLLSKETLMNDVWRDTFVEEANLTVHISTIRKILAADTAKSVSIETFPRRGYRFTGDVKKIESDGDLDSSQLIEATDNADNLSSDSNENHKIGFQTDDSAAKLNRQNEIAEGKTALPEQFVREKPAGSKNRSVLTAVIIISIAVLGSAFVLHKYFYPRHSFETMKIERIVDTGKSKEVSVSPDGKFIAHTVAENSKQSLWIKHIASNSNVQLLAPDAVSFSSLTFSREGDFIFYVTTSKNLPNGVLYRIPVLGGDPKKILANVGGAISFAPDDERFAFVREISPEETALMISDINGGQEKQLAVRRLPEYFSNIGPAWSPDGKSIASANGIKTGERTSNIAVISVEDGTEKQISDQKWRFIGRVAWLADGSGLISAAMEFDGQESGQIWFFPYPSGESRRITNDLNDYGGTSLSANSKTLVAMRSEIRRNISVVPNVETDQAKSLMDDLTDSYRFISWMPDNKIVYVSRLTGNADIWLMNADGSSRKQLTSTSHNDILPTATPDGKYIIFASNRSSTGRVNIWRMNTDGTNIVQLTDGADESLPVPTADSQWILYVSGGNDAEVEQKTIWKVSINGGESVQLTTNPSFGTDVSPDGTQFVCWYKPDKDSPFQAALIPINGGQPTKFLEINPGSPLRWTPDGKAVTYIKTQNSVSNIWSQSVGGEPPKQITNFTAEQILFFDWSKDNHLVCTRGITVREAVLIKNFSNFQYF